jgi:hypothetical protein
MRYEFRTSSALANHYKDGMTDPAPPEAPFPWQSLDHLRSRAQEAREAFPGKFRSHQVLDIV